MTSWCTSQVPSEVSTVRHSRDEEQQCAEDRPVAAPEPGHCERVGQPERRTDQRRGVLVSRNVSAGVKPYAGVMNGTRTDQIVQMEKPKCSDIPRATGGSALSGPG